MGTFAITGFGEGMGAGNSRLGRVEGREGGGGSGGDGWVGVGRFHLIVLPVRIFFVGEGFSGGIVSVLLMFTVLVNKTYFSYADTTTFSLSCVDRSKVGLNCDVVGNCSGVSVGGNRCGSKGVTICYKLSIAGLCIVNSLN